ncbi:hypothetical protein AUK11_02115 [bacterium CG2_30_37_16]|nr:MAG: hypothetical protein AUK11_02115 [bacterium CG2_30_37_16]PIP30924.1 MAG: hypothetical protein COX25_02120 [bacterium (Candidatus Howlettbacteria) CG23_combo_of_CG06-09_8_20_14_all_37_9]PIX99177.1 MAG: hypothetical protein COZ22_03195 [bacterium (Candidatus Howlettbacteria) CG_4_10_14_3_um_filter_37_10]PJB06425.1 MAG: hypothetical protein CO123_02215 [bacterium (Candidatus Howlettbacteria) CG_4_9_14_3_um_filter_37_10]
MIGLMKQKKVNKNLPPKISNLLVFKEIGFFVPDFIVIEKEDIDKIETSLNNLKNNFHKEGYKSIIIRSASMIEDSKDTSNAGVFKSSAEIKLNDLSASTINNYWQENKALALKAGDIPFKLFIQEYIEAEFYGVLFTQSPYDRNQALLRLSSKPRAITDGNETEINLSFDKRKNSWQAENYSIKISVELKRLVTESEKIFAEGADIEIAINNNRLYVLQARPITRSEDEKILLSEGLRLRKLFGKDFEKQEWTINDFVESLGNLSHTSLSFYNSLLKSNELENLLLKAKIIDYPSERKNFSILEQIGGRTYYNEYQASQLFLNKKGMWNDFKRQVKIEINQNLLCKESKDFLTKKNVALEEAFAWLFLCGVYIQFYIDQEKRKFTFEEFYKRLANTEAVCGITEKKPKSNNFKGINRFKKDFYYLAVNQYELGSPRIVDLDNDDLKKFYKLTKEEQFENTESHLLSKKIQFWLKQKAAWKATFLKIIYDNRLALLKQFGKAESSQKIKLSNTYPQISGKNFPFGNDTSKNKITIVPGQIKKDDLYYINEDEDIEKYFGLCVAIQSFPSKWITAIPRLKGLVLKNGNELSHVSITCREYNVPCIIDNSYFKDI